MASTPMRASSAMQPRLVCDQGVEIELADLRHVGGELRELHERQRHGVHVGRRHVAIALRAGDRRACAPSASRASVMSSGGRASDLSLITSTAVPPRPNTTTGPKVGSSARPAISSRPRGRWIMGCTVTPSMTRVGPHGARHARACPARRSPPPARSTGSAPRRRRRICA